MKISKKEETPKPIPKAEPKPTKSEKYNRPIKTLDTFRDLKGKKETR